MFKKENSKSTDYSEIKHDLKEIIGNLQDLFEQLKSLNLSLEFSYSQKDQILFKDQLNDYFDLKKDIEEYIKRFPVIMKQIKAKSLEKILDETTEMEETIVEAFDTLKSECENIFQEIESFNKEL